MSRLKKVAASTETVAKIESLKPTKSDIVAMGAMITEHGDGTWTADLSGINASRALAEAHRPWARAADEQMRTRSASVPVEMLRKPDGTLVPTHPMKAKALAAKQGLRAHESRRPNLIYRNGKWYRRNGKDWVEE